jgi:hypothetical protein
MTDEETSVVPSNSLISIRIGEREYPMVKSPRCAVCMHPGRFQIEEKLMLNFSYPSVVRFISEKEVRGDDGEVIQWPQVSRLQLKYHRDAGHIGLNAEMVHEIAKRRAAQQGFDLENSMGQYVDHIVVNQMVLQQGMEKLVRGEMEIEARDLLAASKMMQDLETTSKQNATQEDLRELIVLYFTEVKAIMNEEQWNRLMGKLQNHPAVVAFRSQQKAIQ